ETIEKGKASPRLLQEPPVPQRLAGHPSPGLRQRVAKLVADLPPADRRLKELQRQKLDAFAKAKADAALGATVFEKTCAACHQLGGQGQKVGPQLDGIGARGAERLLEDLIDPNRNLDPAFRATRIELKNGRDLTGLVLREEGQVLVLADPQGKEVRV